MRRPSRSPQFKETALPFEQCPAKTIRTSHGEVILGRSVLEHCQIVGEVAGELIRRLPATVSQELFPPSAPLVAACHDLGKVCPTFVEKLRRACTPPPKHLKELSDVATSLEPQWGGHAGVSQLAAVALMAPKYVPEILGQHHGFSPSVVRFRAEDEVFGGAAWQQQRKALFEELCSRLGMGWPEVSSVSQARLLAGLTSVADWIGSGSFFEDPEAPWQPNIAAALDSAGLTTPKYRQALTFEDVFGFPPRPAQKQLIDCINGPGVYVLEAPMGLGKTEAALFVAYLMLVSGLATGVYFALPTQLTSNKIYERFNGFLRKILCEEGSHRSLLLHAGAWLVETEMGEEGRPGGSWFSSSKRGLLAPFAVGTLDQALMAAMNVKHGFVRAFGLAGKVVILDEVHTYDAYTSTLLDSLIYLLRSLRCTVIILSATLSQERRSQLLANVSMSQGYPLITALPNGEALQEHVVPHTEFQRVELRLSTCLDGALEQALQRAEWGQQVLWIENTVAEAQQRYLELAARAKEIGIECGLLHSRFTPEDRQRLEETWVAQFGKEGWPYRRERGRILIGTQVLEQSLDIDADFLISRFAPTDMLLQRLGRLWRHQETPRPKEARCECWLLAPSLERALVDPYQAFGSTAFVYSPYVLCRSLEVWQQLSDLELPTDIRDLIENTYVSRQEEGVMARLHMELEEGTNYRKGRKSLTQLARVTLSQGGKTLPESKAQTRYSETDTHQVLLVRSVELQPKGRGCQLRLINGEKVYVPGNSHELTRSEWRRLSAKLMEHVVAARIQEVPHAVSRDSLLKMGLGNCFYLGDHDDDDALLRMALVDESGQIQGLYGSQAHNSRQLEYRADLGFRVLKF